MGWNYYILSFFFFFSSRRRHTRCSRDWSSDVCSSDLILGRDGRPTPAGRLLQWLSRRVARRADAAILVSEHLKQYLSHAHPIAAHIVRSEERRVGKECRSRWAASHEKEKERQQEESLK